MVHDPIATLLWCDGKLWLCVGEIVAIKVDGRAVDKVLQHLLKEDNVRISFQLLGLRPSTLEEDPTAIHDWRTYAGTPDSTFSVPGCLLELLNPTVASLPSQPSQLFYLFDSTVLIAISAGLLSRASLDNLKLIPKIALLNPFPY